MIQEAIKEFEGNVWGPAVQILTAKIEKNDQKTDTVLHKLSGVKGAIWTCGVFFSVPGLIWICMEIYKSITH